LSRQIRFEIFWQPSMKQFCSQFTNNFILPMKHCYASVWLAKYRVLRVLVNLFLRLLGICNTKFSTNMSNIICGTHFVLGITYTRQKKKHTPKQFNCREQAASVKRFTNKNGILKRCWADNYCLLQNCTLIHTERLTHWPFLRRLIQYLTVFIL